MPAKPPPSFAPEWVPLSTTHPEITYFHLLPAGAWKWASGVTTDFPALHTSDNTGINFVNSGICP